MFQIKAWTIPFYILRVEKVNVESITVFILTFCIWGDTLSSQYTLNKYSLLGCKSLINHSLNKYMYSLKDFNNQNGQF